MEFEVTHEEDGASYLTFSVNAQEREAIDKRCLSLAMSKGKATKPCGMVAQETYTCWKSPSRNTFLETIVQRRSYPVQVVDSLTDPLFGGRHVNIALLRIQLPPDTPIKFKILDGFPNPAMVQWMVVILADVFRDLYQAVTRHQVRIHFEVV